MLGLLMATHACGQNPIFDAFVRANSDVAEVRRRAEAGDAAAEVAFGDILTSRMRHADALLWYRKAADQRNVSGQFHVGGTLLHGAIGIPADQNVKADPAQGLGWVFMAATNGNSAACADMSFALQRGVGTDVDLVAAYAWLKLRAESSGFIDGYRFELNQLALKMTTAEVEHAKTIAAWFKAGHWQMPVIRVIPNGDPRLKLTGIATGLKTPFAVINGHTLSAGESATIDLKVITLRLKCLKIEESSVVVSLEGEDQPRVLGLPRKNGR